MINSPSKKRLRKRLANYSSLLEEMVQKQTQELINTNQNLESEIKRREVIEGSLKEKMKEVNEKASNLEKSNKELKDATELLVQTAKFAALGELTAGIAHELNQPLNGIKIIAQSILLDVSKNRFEIESLPDDLNDIINQINRMAEIIDHMRIFTRRFEWGIKEQINVNSIMENAFKFVDQQIKVHNIKVIKNLSPDLPKIKGDPVQIEQVFLNIISNARYALDDCQKKDKEIEIKSYCIDNRFINGNSCVIIEIIDNGIGIADEIKSKILQPFFTTKDPGKGTGLGLSISKKIIEEHNGKLEFESKKGEGALFRIILPV